MPSFDFNQARRQLEGATKALEHLQLAQNLNSPGFYKTVNKELYGRVEETCPVLERIVKERCYEKMGEEAADALIEEIKKEITFKFRAQLREVLEHKHALLDSIKHIHGIALDAGVKNRTPIEKSGSYNDDEESAW